MYPVTKLTPHPSGSTICEEAGAAGTESPERVASLLSRVVLALLRFYKWFISPLLPSACRFHPTCSEYMMQAVSRYGAVRGVWMGVKRLLRCHPFHEGGFDPVR